MIFVSFQSHYVQLQRELLEPRIPFIDPTGLLSAMEQAYGGGPALSPAEIKRDEFRGARSFQLLGGVTSPRIG